ncbi:MAG: hypothetical protein ACR2IS_00160 [Nitrososphaeraceae archaeon]
MPPWVSLSIGEYTHNLGDNDGTSAKSLDEVNDIWFCGYNSLRYETNMRAIIFSFLVDSKVKAQIPVVVIINRSL